MSDITIRNIPNDIFNKLKKLAVMEKRSLNSEILVILEKGLISEMEKFANSAEIIISKNAQLDFWKKIAGQWEDNRSTEEIINDIYNARTPGRDISL